MRHQRADTMQSADSQRPDLVQVLARVRKKGVRLWTDNGRLRYAAPAAALTQEDLDELRSCRDEIIAVLADGAEASHGGEKPAIEPTATLAPLTYTQRARWNQYCRNERRPMRTLGSVVRIRGPLNLERFHRSLHELVRRHDALRTHLVLCDGTPAQKTRDTLELELSLQDLTDLELDCREQAASELINQLVSESVDLFNAPLLAVRVLKIAEHEHLFVVAMEHLISDMASIAIFVRELFSTYRQSMSGEPVLLPLIPVQLSDHARWQQGVERQWIKSQAAHWDRLIACPRLRFPEDRDAAGQAAPAVWGSVATALAGSLLADLRRWCRRHRTTLVMAVLTAYVALLLRWCDVSETVIQFQADGRHRPGLDNTIGFFASALYLRVGPLVDHRFIDLLAQLTNEYCRAQAQADSGYLAARLPAPEVTRNTLFNWIPTASSVSTLELEGTEDAISWAPVPFARLIAHDIDVDQEPSIAFFAGDLKIEGSIYFPASRFTHATMERFSRTLLAFVRILLEEPDRPVRTLPLA